MKQISSPTISIIIPVYNSESYIQECLDSLSDQTFNDFEVIVVDDGSTDATPKLIEEYSKTSDFNIKLLRQENGGAAKARNNGMNYVSGEYIAFIDADDTVSPDYLETLIGSFDDTVDIVSCGYEKYDTSSGKIAYVRNASDWELDFGNGATHLLHYSPCAKLIRTSLIRNNGLRFKEGEILEDGPFGIMTNSLARKNIALPYIGYQYRIHDGSVQDSVRKEGMSESNNAMRPPFNGLREAIEKVLEKREAEYHQVLEYVVAKALAGYVFSFSKSDSVENLDFICAQSAAILDKYFPDVANNEFMRVGAFKNLPFVHRAATIIFVKAYDHRKLPPVVRFFHFFLKHGKHI